MIGAMIISLCWNNNFDDDCPLPLSPLNRNSPDIPDTLLRQFRTITLLSKMDIYKIPKRMMIIGGTPTRAISLWFTGVY